MPFYEYECSKCRYYVEVLQKLSDPPLKKCPSCGKSALRKLVSAPVFRLKGSGWYETDFKSDQEHRRNLAGADKDAPAPDAAAKDTTAKDTGKAPSPEGAKAGVATATADAAKAPAAAKPSRAASRSSVAAARGGPKARLKAKRAAVRTPSRRPKRRGGR
jgi:putative FmdB family regulatory protein